MTTEKPSSLHVPPTEVSASGRRRTFSAAYKRQILAECDAATEPGAIGAILRREGLYSSHLVKWRRAERKGKLAGEGQKRGPVARDHDDRNDRIAQLERDN